MEYYTTTTKYKIKKTIFLSLVYIISTIQIQAELDFIQSFVRFYEISNEGRFTHEYHPFLLKKTANSFTELENALLNNGFHSPYRIIIMGYEKEAAPSYFFNPFTIKGNAIHDESVQKTLFGISPECHNLFGFMTGFLLRNLPPLPMLQTKHIGKEQIVLFDPRATRFQKDFFGSLYHYCKDQEQNILTALYHNDHKRFMQECINFWSTLYHQNINNKDQHVAGTQDILFTIEHAEHIKDSPIPLHYFFTGADITYPINETTIRSKKATRNAQKFVAHLTQTLQAINNKKTLYIFRSFVDGVGKSTMLGNIKNWMQHGAAIEHYETIDNGSSQIADIFQYDRNIFIADLPAQLSHFTYKPDGAVFVNIKNLSQLPCNPRIILEYFEKNETTILQLFKKTLQNKQSNDTQTLLTKKNEDYYSAYCKNLLLLNHITTDYIPFTYDNQTFLYTTKTKELLLCVPFAQAPSEGLKNSCPEQMIFNEGIRFPLSYQHFLESFIKECKKTGATEIVFVDFLSMYARSSREVIRVNYLIQQMQALFKTIDYQKSLYAGFISNGALLHHLNQKENFQKTADYITCEALTRSLLFNMITTYTTLHGIELPKIHTELQKQINNNYSTKIDATNTIISLVNKKLTTTHSLLLEHYKNNKEFVHLLSSDLNNFCLLSNAIEEHMKSIKLAHENPWHNIGKIVEENEKVPLGKTDRLIQMDTKKKMKALFIFDPQNTDIALRAELFSLLKQWWIPSLISAAAITSESHNTPYTETFKYPLLPLVIKPGKNGLWYLLQKHISKKDTKKIILQQNTQNTTKNNLPIEIPFNPSLLNVQEQNPIEYQVFDETLYISSFKPTDVGSGIYNFGYDQASFTNTKQMYPLLLDIAFAELLKPILDPLNAQTTIPLRKAYEYLLKNDRHSFFNFCQKEIEKQAIPPKQKNLKNQKVETRDPQNQSILLLPSILSNWTKKSILLLAHVLALAPDPHSPFAIHRTSKKDFHAALMLIQKIVLPQYGHILHKDPLWTIEEINETDTIHKIL